MRTVLIFFFGVLFLLFPSKSVEAFTDEIFANWEKKINSGNIFLYDYTVSNNACRDVDQNVFYINEWWMGENYCRSEETIISGKSGYEGFFNISRTIRILNEKGLFLYVPGMDETFYKREMRGLYKVTLKHRFWENLKVLYELYKEEILQQKKQNFFELKRKNDTYKIWFTPKSIKIIEEINCEGCSEPVLKVSGIYFDIEITKDLFDIPDNFEVINSTGYGPYTVVISTFKGHFLINESNFWQYKYQKRFLIK